MSASNDLTQIHDYLNELREHIKSLVKVNQDFLDRIEKLELTPSQSDRVYLVYQQGSLQIDFDNCFCYSELSRALEHFRFKKSEGYVLQELKLYTY